MQKLVTALLTGLFILITATGFAQISDNDIFDISAIKVIPKYEQAAIQWDTFTKRDLGVISQGTEIEYEFKFTNTSNEPISIENVNTLGMGIVPSWENEPILPNQMGIIKITFHASESGKFNQIIKVCIKNVRQSETLYLSGKVI